MKSQSHKIFKQDYDKYQNSPETITEATIENALIYFLAEKKGYVYNDQIKNSQDLKNNFHYHLEKLNNLKIPATEFEKIWIELNQGDTFGLFHKITYNQPKVKIDGSIYVLDYFDFKNPKNNSFEIINQLWTTNKQNGNNRFDVLLLVNGIPLVHLELKNENQNFHDASRQINFYKEIEAISKFLNLVKIFVISNGKKTEYWANNNNILKLTDFKSYSWTDQDNVKILELLSFAQEFFEQSFLLNFINNCFIPNEEELAIQIMRPYQYHAVNNIINKINDPNLSNKEKSGYIWHATGSGKTLTCFKLCEILAQKSPQIDLTVFLVDRNDLNIQTRKRFNEFANFKESVKIKDATSTNDLIEILNDKNSNTKIIITTIQKLNYALTKKNRSKLKGLENKQIVFVVDEGHRSQIGIMRRNINNYFKNAINIAFTGTPIFSTNSEDGKTTQNIFGDLIHKYVTLNAIEDKNVLPITVSFCNSEESSDRELIQDYEDDFEDDFENDNIVICNETEILEKVKFIRDNYNKVTRDKTFNVMVACSGIKIAIKYYELFIKEAPELRTKIIFSCKSSDFSSTHQETNEQKSFMLEQIQNYNKTWSLKEIDKYKEHIQSAFSDKNERTIDVLIVVSMLLTGFDSKVTNTLFLDKKLRYHSLVQAFSRVNRIYSGKEAGNVIAFSTSKEDVENAFRLYTNGDINVPLDENTWKPITYDQLKESFNNGLEELMEKFGSIEAIYNLVDEDEIQDFIRLCNNLIKIFNRIKPMIEFDWSHFPIDQRKFKQLHGAYKTHQEKDRDRITIWVNDEYQIVNLEEIVIDSKFLRSLVYLDGTKTYQEILDDMDQYKVFRNPFQRELIGKIINTLIENDPERKKTQVEVNQIIQDKLNSLRDNKIDELSNSWKTSKETIKWLLESLKIKEIVSDDTLEKELSDYIPNILEAEEKLVKIREELNNLLFLDNLTEEINLEISPK